TMTPILLCLRCGCLEKKWLKRLSESTSSTFSLKNFAKADQIEASYKKLKAKIEQLPQALLAKAFRGELVDQLPTDGDARDLLERIKLAKAGLEKGGKGKKLKVEDEVRMVAEEVVRYGKR
ncbi:MAG: hypothetical protein Q8P34_09550, partial [Bacteroidota bacterium]|nr:hypothetical protein [Bacteroidota bacterium]